MEYRIERDSMGEMQVPADRYWGAQTQRSKQNFVIGGEIMPREITHAFGILKKAAAIANHEIKPEKMTRRKARRDLQSVRRSDRGQAERPFPAGRMADRQRHAVEHERERSDREPRQRNRGAKSSCIRTTT